MPKYTEEQKKEILSRIKDKTTSEDLSTLGKFVDRSEENTDLNLSGRLRNDLTIADEVKTLTEPVKAIAKAGLTFSGAVSSGLANAAKKLGVYERYMYSKEDILQEAKNISIETGIPESAILDNPKNLDNAREVYNYRRKQMALVAPGENEFSMEEVFERFPGLKEIAEGSTTDAAIALHNIENVKKVKSIVEAAKVGWNADTLQQKLVNIGRKGMYGEGFSKEDYDEADSIRKQIGELPEMPSLLEAPATAVAGGVSQQAGLQFRGIREGLKKGTIFGTAGALLGGVIGAATTGGIGARAMAIAGGRLGTAWGARLGFAQNMLEESAALRFLEYSEFKDKNGKKLLTDNEARAYAVASAAVETGIEFANTEQILKTLSGTKGNSADVLRDIIKNSVDTGTLRKGLQTFLNMGKISASESLEEGVQEVADRAISTVAAKYWKPEGNIPSYTGTEMIEGGIANTIEALPASLGFGILAQGGSSISLVRRAASAARINNEAVKETMRNNNGFGMLERLKSDNDVQDFMKKAPDAAEKVMKANLEGSGFETINVDTELAIQEEGAHQILNQMAQKAGITEEELNASIESQSSIAIPTEIYYQIVMGSPFADIFKKYISFSDIIPSEARSKYYSDMLAGDIKSLYEKDIQKQAEIIDNILETNFKEGLERDAAAFIITQYPNNPKAGWQEERRMLQEKYDAIINPALKLLEQGMKQGVEVIRPSGEGRGYRESRNAPWYREFYAQNKRPPTQVELKQIAYEVVTGTGTTLPGWENNSPEAAESLALNKEALDSLRTEIEALDAIKGKIDTLSASEIALTKGLSKEGYKVYKAVDEVLKQAPTKQSKRSGRASAIILARHADRIAEVMRDSGVSDYTALDYFNERIGIKFGGEKKVSAFNQASQFTIKLTGNEFGKYKDISELRSKAVEYYRKNLQGTTAYNPALGEIRLGKGMSQNDLAFNVKGRKKMEHTGARAEKLLSVKHLRELIEGAKFITESDGNERKNAGEHFYYLHSAININEQEKFIITTIKEDQEQRLTYYNHNVFEPAEYKKIEDVIYEEAPGLTTPGENLQETSSSEDTNSEALVASITRPGQNPREVSSFTNSISGKGNVYKQQRVYYQTAFHGSSHRFEKFDLGAIGTGLGAQAHGWGLYFAENKEVAAEYRRKLTKSSSPYTVVYDGKIDEKITNILSRSLSGPELYEMASGKKIDLQSSIARSIEAYSRDNKSIDKLISILQEQINKIEDNPKISITKFLKEVPSDEKDRFETLAKSATQEAKAAGRRANISDVLRRLRAHIEPFIKSNDRNLQDIKLLESIDTSKVEVRSPGSVFEVDIPEKEVMLDEQKAFSEQSDFVKEKLVAISKVEENVNLAQAIANNATGRKLYKAVSSVGRKASETLNKYGIEGISYHGLKDGRCFVVFDDQAIKIINSYNQKVNNVESTLGQIDITEGGSRIISLFEKANESTFAHESGHLFLADLKELAEIDNAPEWVKKDWETVKEWLGWEEGQESFTVEQHEKFADTFLEYLRSGDAPALSLKAVFRQFKRWLSALYKDIIGAGVKPSAEVKAVMDRMIATQEEVDEVMLLNRANEFQKKGGMNGVSSRSGRMYLRWLEEAKQEAYEKTLQKAMQDVTDKEAANKREFLTQMRQSITEELEQEPVFVAEKFVKKNPKLLNNWPTEVFKLTLEEYKQQLEEAGGSLEAAVDKRMEVEQELAEKAALDEASVREQAERAVIDNKYKARYLAFEEEALQARRREEVKRSREMKNSQSKAHELTEKNKKISQGLRIYRDNVLAKTNAIRDYAKGIMSDMSIQEATNPIKWRNLEKRAGIESTRALAKKDWNDAIKMKTMQRVYAELAALAQRNKDSINKTIDRAIKRQKSINKNNHVPVDERYIFNHGLYVLGIAPRDAMQPSESRSLEQVLADYAANNEAFFVDENGVVDLPGWVISALEGKGRYKRGYRSLTVDEFDGFMDLLNTIYKLGLDANKIKTMTDANGQIRFLNEVCEQIVFEGIQNVPRSGKQLNRIGSPGIIEQATLLKNETLIEITKPETILDELGKTAHRYIYGPIDHAANKRRVMDKESIEQVNKLFSVYSKAERNSMRKSKKYRFGEELLTKEEIICMALNWGTEINRRRIMDGYNISAEQVEELLGNLDKRDWELVTGIWNLVNSYWPETVAVEERMTGTAPRKEEASEFVVTGIDGEVYTLAGGYYPIYYDPSKSLATSNQQQVDAVKMQMPNNAVLGRRRGFTKARSKTVVGRPVKLSFDVLSSHLDDVIHNICYRESVRDVNRILNNKGVVEMIQERYGIETVKMLQQWARDNWAQDKRSKSRYEKIGAFFRRNQVTAAIGFRVVTAALGALNTTMLIEDIGFTGTLKAMKNFYRRPKEQAKFVFSKSSFMNQRVETMERDQNDALKNSNPITKHAFDVMTIVDLSMSLPLWLSEYQRVYQEMISADTDAGIVDREAVSAADKAVRKIFGSGDIKDLAPIQKGSELQKNISMYYSFFNILYQRLHTANMKRRRSKMHGEDLKAQLAPLAKTILFSLVMPGAIEQLIKAMSDDDEDDAVTIFAKMLRGAGDYTVGMIPVIRDVYSMAMTLIFDGKYYSSRSLPIYDAVNGVIKTIQSIKSDRQDWIDTTRIGLRSSVGAVAGVPYVLTDALTTTMRWVDDDFDQDFYEYIKAVVMDKKLE